jgi:hypothetical protein
VTKAPAPSGDPVPERGGTVSSSQAVSEDAPPAGLGAPSPRAALRRYALTYTNWSAASLAAHERELATLAVGPARLAAEQMVASQSAAAALAANHVENKGVVLSITEGEGPAQAQWVIVAEERTSGSGAYAGLPAGLHVTLARVERLGRRWTVSRWSPQD